VGEFLSQKEPENNDSIILRQQLETESLFLDIQRKRLYPMFNAVAGISQSRQQYSIASGSPMYRVSDRYLGVSVNWSVFDGFATRAAIMSSRARKRQDEIRYRQAKESLPEDAQREARQTDLAFRQMRINDRLYEDRGVYLQAREQDFKQGTASETDLNAVRAGYIQAKITAYGSRAAYLQQFGELLGFIMQDPIVRQVKVSRP
jgi:outer membrane protein TolC